MKCPSTVPARASARGAANWLLVLGLLLMASLASAWSLRAVWLDLLGTQARSQAQQARWAAQAALASGQAVLQQTLSPQAPDPFSASTTACPPNAGSPSSQAGRPWASRRRT